MFYKEIFMKKMHFISLSSDAIKALKKIANRKTYTTDTPLHYQGQHPIVAYLVLKGNILLLKKNKIYHKLSKGALAGYQELFSNTPSLYTAQVTSDSEICYIDKSTLLEIKNSKSPELNRLYTELTNTCLC